MKYVLRSVRFPKNRALLAYNHENILDQISFDGEWELKQISYFLRVVPVHSDDLRTTLGTSFHISTEIISLEFIDFWNTYAYKVGNKSRAEKLWRSLSDIEKATCMKSIKTYDAYLFNHPKMEKCYPETYLAQRRFEGQYK